MDLKHPTTITPPPHSQSLKLLTFPNGNSHHHHHPLLSPLSSSTAATYKECLKNHAVAVGGHAIDGCGEFMPVPTYSPLELSSLKCAACGCHRNFHRREPTTVTTASASLSPPSPPPEPKDYAYGPLVLSLGPAATTVSPATPAAMKFNEKKRFRTKFSSDQKQKMLNFSERLGWKMQRCDDKMVADFCNEIGIRSRIFKVWMHNNKNTLAKRDKHIIDAETTAGATTTTSNTAVASGSLGQENGSSSSSQNR